MARLPFHKVKLGHFLKFAYICTCNKQIEEAAEHLKELARKVDESKMGKPTFLMVLTCLKCRGQQNWILLPSAFYLVKQLSAMLTCWGSLQRSSC